MCAGHTDGHRLTNYYIDEAYEIIKNVEIWLEKIVKSHQLVLYFWRVLSILNKCAGVSRPAKIIYFSTKSLKISIAKKTKTKNE